MTSPAVTTPTYRVRALKVTALVDVEKLSVIDVHSTTSKKHDSKIGSQIARHNASDLRSIPADRGYDTKAFRDELRDNGIRPLIKHRIINPIDHLHNARMNRARYNRHPMSETVLSSIKRTIPKLRWSGLDSDFRYPTTEIGTALNMSSVK